MFEVGKDCTRGARRFPAGSVFGPPSNWPFALVKRLLRRSFRHWPKVILLINDCAVIFVFINDFSHLVTVMGL